MANPHGLLRRTQPAYLEGRTPETIHFVSLGLSVASLLAEEIFLTDGSGSARPIARLDITFNGKL